jgi:hypothetical protein
MLARPLVRCHRAACMRHLFVCRRAPSPSVCLHPAGIADFVSNFSRLADYGKTRKGVVRKFAVLYA